MDLSELVEKAGGEYVRNCARVRVNGEWVVIGAAVGNTMQMTAEGAAMTKELEAAKPKRGRPKKDVVVEADELLPEDLGLED